MTRSYGAAASCARDDAQDSLETRAARKSQQWRQRRVGTRAKGGQARRADKADKARAKTCAHVHSRCHSCSAGVPEAGSASPAKAHSSLEQRSRRWWPHRAQVHGGAGAGGSARGSVGRIARGGPSSCSARCGGTARRAARTFRSASAAAAGSVAASGASSSARRRPCAASGASAAHNPKARAHAPLLLPPTGAAYDFLYAT